jgi:hypothetical protein
MLGRPPVPFPWASLILAFALTLLLAETWQLAIPVLEGTGVRTSDLRGELQRNPTGVVLGLVFAIGAAVSLFYFADLAVRRTADLLDGLSQRSRLVWTAAAAIGSLGLAAGVSWAIIGLRPAAQNIDAEYARSTLFLLALALPITTACMLSLARRVQATRDEALRRAVEWDQAHYRVLSDWTRSASALASAERDLARVDAARVEAIRRLRMLQQRALLAERFAAEAAAEEEQELERLCNAAISALELDRYGFLRMVGPASAPVAHPRARAQAQLEPTHRDGLPLGIAR